MTKKKETELSRQDESEIELMKSAGDTCRAWLNLLVEEAIRGNQTDELLDKVKECADVIHHAKQRMMM